MIDPTQLYAVMLAGPLEGRKIHDLYEFDRTTREKPLLRSGPAYELTEEEGRILWDLTYTRRYIALRLSDEALLGHVSVHRRVTDARACKATIEEVVSHPDKEFKGSGVGLALMTVAINNATKAWWVRKFDLHAHANVIRFYERLGFKFDGPYGELDMQKPLTGAFAEEVPNWRDNPQIQRPAWIGNDNIHVFALKPPR